MTAPDLALLAAVENEFGRAAVSQYLIDNELPDIDAALACCANRVDLLWGDIEEWKREWEWANSGIGRGA